MYSTTLMNGQRILVTGGGDRSRPGDGERLLSLGADVAICGRRKAVCDETAATWRRSSRAGASTRSASTSATRSRSRRWSSRCGRTAGSPASINNAAGNFIAPTESLSPRAFDAIANIVFTARFYVDAGDRQALGHRGEIRDWKAGSPFRNVMSIITTWVDNGSPFVVPSAMSKAGIEVMTKSLAIEWTAVRRPPQRSRAGRDPHRGHEQAPQPG